MGCLDGLVVLDLARRYPAAYTAMFLADFGADVIKVDPPGPSLLPRSRGVSEERFAAYYALDRNKRSLTLDLKAEAGREVMNRLVRRADVLVEGFRPGVMDRLGLGYGPLSELNPRLIYCSLSGFGQSGPYAQIPAHDTNFIAIGGALSLIGERNGRPFVPSNIIADFAGAGLHGVVGILLAVAARTGTGRGQLVDVAYLDSVISLLASTASDYFQSGVVPRRGETRLTGAAPWTQLFRCKDGKYFSIAPTEPPFWANLCRALGREDLIPEHQASGERCEWVVAELAAVFATRTRDEWFALLKDRETCVAPVYELDETFEDPQVAHRQMVVEAPHPTFGTVRQVGIPIKLSETPGEVRRLGVPTGTDTAAILGELGYDADQIASLREQRIVG